MGIFSGCMLAPALSEMVTAGLEAQTGRHSDDVREEVEKLAQQI